MGKVITIPGLDFSDSNLGRVTFVDPSKTLQALSIDGPASVTGTEAQYNVIYDPIDTSERAVNWSIISGSEYASIDNFGHLSILNGALNSPVVLGVVSAFDSSITATKSVTVTYSDAIVDNEITVTATATAVEAVLEHAAASDVSITVGQLGTILILAGSSSGSLTIQAAQESRTVGLSVSPVSDSNYRYVLSSDSVTIPAVGSLNVALVGSQAGGSIRAGKFSLLDLDTMKRVVGTSEEVTDENAIYYGPISWAVTAGNQFAEMATSAGTDGFINILPGASQDSVIIAATINGQIFTKALSVTYIAADYHIQSLLDLKAIETCVNSGTESELAITKDSSSSYAPINRQGFSGAVFVLDNDIDCGSDHVEIGNYNTSTGHAEYFAGTIDGRFYRMYNIGGDCGINGSAAEGGKVGSILIGHAQAATVRNIIFDGSVRNIASRGFAPIIAMTTGRSNVLSCWINVNITCASSLTSGITVCCGWGTGDSSEYVIEDSVYSGSAVNNHSISGFCNIEGSIDKCAMIGSLEVVATTRNNSTITCLLSYNTGSSTNCLAAGSLKNSKTGTYDPGAVSISQVPTNSYEANTIQVISSASFSNATGTYVYSINNLVNATPVTISELQNDTTVTGANWIHSTGYLPIINNIWACDSRMLAIAKIY